MSADLPSPPFPVAPATRAAMVNATIGRYRKNIFETLRLHPLSCLRLYTFR
jgi:hypothetical protein